MKKDGFTLVEIIISIVLVSVLLVSMLVSLIKLREASLTVDDDSDVRIIGSSLSKIINEDFINNCGIKNLNCITDKECSIAFNNGEVRKLTLRVHSEKGNSNIEKNITTIEYINNISNVKITTKTFTSITTSSINSKGESSSSTENYHITKLSSSSKKYSTILGEQTIFSLTLNMSDPKYNIVLYGNSV